MSPSSNDAKLFLLGLFFGVGLILERLMKINIGLIIGVGLTFGETCSCLVGLNRHMFTDSTKTQKQSKRLQLRQYKPTLDPEAKKSVSSLLL